MPPTILPRYWHSPQLKQGDSCFNHYCIGDDTMRYFNVLHSVHKLDYTVPVCPTVQSYIYLYWPHLQSFIQDVLACVGIPVMHCMTVRTLPYSHCQIFYQWILISTTRTGLTAWIHSWYFYNIIPIPCSLICKHIKELTPWRRTYVLCQLMITHHIFYFQIFYTDCLVFTNQYRWLLL